MYPWNKDLNKIWLVCKGCKKKFFAHKKHIYCSRKCQLKYNSGRFKKGHPFLKGGEKGWFKKGNSYWLGKKRKKETEEKRIKKWIKSIHLKPNKKEKELEYIINQIGLPYKFVGDGQVIIGNKIPDFINCNGKKKIIELFGNYWHKPEEESKRIEHFAKYGFKTLIIWEHELKKRRNMTNKIIEFDRR